MMTHHQGTAAGWVKATENPVLGGELGTCFDISVLASAGRYRMWFSWRPKESIALVESEDGIHWNAPRIVLAPDPASRWEKRLNRPVVLEHEGRYHAWYTGQSQRKSWIGYATSADGVSWTRSDPNPVLSPRAFSWEKPAVMCPHVLWDAKQKVFRMWYSGGGQYEPKGIGHATSTDGVHWAKHPKPVFAPDRRIPWERARVAACQVVEWRGWFVMFYIGFADIDHAAIGLARSRDGILGWERHPANPIIAPTPGTWDHDACYKPYAIFDGKRWMLWYNGRHGSVEQIGLATRAGDGLGFDP